MPDWVAVVLAVLGGLVVLWAALIPRGDGERDRELSGVKMRRLLVWVLIVSAVLFSAAVVVAAYSGVATTPLAILGAVSIGGLVLVILLVRPRKRDE